MELAHFKDDIYEIIEYVIIDPDKRREVHKKINIKFKKDLHGNIVAHEVYGTWRNMGFWTDKNFVAEEPIAKLIDKVDSMFNESKSIAEVKQQIYETMEKLIVEDETMVNLKTKIGSTAAYGADHNTIDLHPFVKANYEKHIEEHRPFSVGDGKEIH